MSFWDVIVFMFWGFILFAYLMMLFQIFGDLFRDKELGGFAKAIWVLALIFLPLLTALIYLVARGQGMAERQMKQAQEMQAAQAAYIKETAGAASPTDEIARAKELLDAGTITAAEFDSIKTRALN